MPAPNLSALLPQVSAIAKQTGAWIRSQHGQIQSHDIEVKSLNSFVSFVDQTAERQLVDGLHQLLPDAGFIVEESTIDTEHKPWMWIIDPLDGTTNFLHGLPMYAISIGLMHHNTMQLGVVYEISMDELFTASLGGGSALNGQSISISNRSGLKNGLIATGFPYYDFGQMPQYLALLGDFFQTTRGLRRLGSAATDLAYVAAGRFDGFFEYGLSPWDVAAGALLVTEAGGTVTDFFGEDNYIFGKTILASSPGIHLEFREKVIHRFKYNH
jgi:myo-inositol-1(or 4)-monophosphatase